MRKCSRIDPKGYDILDEDSLKSYRHYSIQEKIGLYLVSRHNYHHMKEILPINFPILPLNKID